MLEKGSTLIRELQGARAQLNEQRADFALHVSEDHPSGIPATSCHDCLNFKQYILFSEEAVKDIERMISISPNF
jgi:hypothetical protein